MKRCPGHPPGSCATDIPDGWTLCKFCRKTRRIAAQGANTDGIVSRPTNGQKEGER
jgi:hypothetical protein